MMKYQNISKFIAVTVIIFGIFVGSVFVFDSTTSNHALAAVDPVPDANECYEGGALYRPDQEGNGCPTSWHWNAGYYLAQWNASGGCQGTYPVPEQYTSILPDCTPVIIESEVLPPVKPSEEEPPEEEIPEEEIPDEREPLPPCSFTCD